MFGGSDGDGDGDGGGKGLSLYFVLCALSFGLVVGFCIGCLADEYLCRDCRFAR